MPVLQDHSIVITGASRGIGAALAVGFAREGARVTLGARSEEELRAVARQCEEAGGQAAWRVTDTADPAAMQRLVDEAVTRFGPQLHAFVNNAAVGLPGITSQSFRSMFEVPEEVFERMLRINVVGYYSGMRVAVPWLRPGGVLVNVSSETARMPSPPTAHYGATKAAVDALTRTAAVALEGRARVNAFSPGQMTDTNLFGPGRMPEAWKQRGFMVPEACVPAATWLVSDAAADVTGIFLSAHLFNRVGEAGIRQRLADGDRGWGDLPGRP